MLVFRWFCLCILMCCGIGSFAQPVPDTSLNKVIPDSLRERKAAEADLREQTPEPVITASSSSESAISVKHAYQPNPKKSALYAAICPGLGQINNREYWKVPVVYVGVGVATYFLINNTRQYQRYRQAYVQRLSNPNYQDEFTDLYPNNPNLPAILKSNQDLYKKWLDMTYLYTGVGYIIQIIDALAFAHLKNFDISKDISFRFRPVSNPQGVGFGLVASWR